MTRVEASILDSPRDGPALPEEWVRTRYGQNRRQLEQLPQDGDGMSDGSICTQLSRNQNFI